MKTNRILAVLFATLMLLGLFAGCGSTPATTAINTPAPQSATPEPTLATEEPTDQLEHVTLEFLFIMDPTDSWDEVWAKIAEYVKPTLNCDFKSIFTPFADAANKLTVLAASGDDFDMAFDASWLNYNTMRANGAYMDVSKLLPEYAPDYYQKLKDQGLLSAVQGSDGSITALPWICQFADFPYLAVMQKTALTDMGLSVQGVTTFEEMDALFQKVMAVPESSNYYILAPGMCANFNGNMRIALCKYESAEKFHELYGFNYDMKEYLDTGKITLVPIEQTAAFKDCVYWTTKWTEEGIIPSDYATNPDAYTNVPKEKWLFENGFHEYAYYHDAFGYGGTVSEYDVSWLYPGNKYSIKSPLANLLCINENAANPERTLMFIDMVGKDQPLFNLVQYGIEGLTYTIDEKGFIAFDNDKNNYHQWAGQWGFWRQDMFLPTSTQPKEMWNDLKAKAASGQSFADPLAGFVADIESIKNEIALRTTLDSEKGIPLSKGIGTTLATYEADLEAYIASQKTAGCTDIILAELQKQVNAYLGQ